MCGRFAFYSSHGAIARLFGVSSGGLEVEPRYNIAPTRFVPTVRAGGAGVRRLAMLYWGLVPPWAKDRSIGARMINARAETLAEKPAFRTAFRQRRCLVLANGWYEWQAGAGGKQPFYIRRDDGEPFAFAGLWERWTERAGEPPLESCTIVTTAASEQLSALHARMPVVLRREAYELWLDPGVTDTAKLLPLLAGEEASAGARELRAVPVSRRVNDARNEGPELIGETPAGSQG